MENNNISKVSFCAIQSPNIVRRVRKEFNGNRAKIEQFNQLFNDIFSKTVVDDNTIINIDSKHRIVLSNKNFPNIKRQHKGVDRGGNTYAQTVLRTCTAQMRRAEYKLIRKIVSTLVNSGKSLDEVEEMANLWTNLKSKEFYLNTVELARLIKAENPNSKLTQKDFVEMELRMLD